jgi:exodeoxyribonuclease VII large subunit
MLVLDVPKLTAYLKSLLEEDPLLSDLWVRGEVTNFSRSSAGHMYFNLTDGATQLSCVLFRGNQRGLLARPINGEAVLAHGRVTLYEPRGQYQLMVDNVAPEGMGILQLEFEETKRRLEADGLFALERKRPLPDMPRVIGVVTSAQGAVLHDIQTVLRRRFPLVELVLAPAAVQGANAAQELIAALRALQDDGRAELIILARGGGSAEDLACFNDERLARAIFAARLPIVSAIGHETNTTIADLVADLRAPTPSIAAELCVPDAAELQAGIGSFTRRAGDAIDARLASARGELALLASRLERHHPVARVQRERQTIDALRLRAANGIARHLEQRAAAVREMAVRAELLDPRDVLRRGYAIVSSTSGGRERRVASAQAARENGLVRITFGDGAVPARVSTELDMRPA